MIINDYISITDSKTVRGFVVLKRGNDVIFAKENMIVSDGRKFIRELFIKNGLSETLSYSEQYSEYKLNALAFGSSGLATELSTVSLGSEISGKRVLLTENVVDLPTGEMYILFKGAINIAEDLDGVIIRELGLYLTHITQADKLFSRIVFDPIPVEPGESYEVEYYIYF